MTVESHGPQEFLGEFVPGSFIHTGHVTSGPVTELGSRQQRGEVWGGLETGLITTVHISYWFRLSQSFWIPVTEKTSQRGEWVVNNQGEMTIPLVNTPLCLSEPFVLYSAHWTNTGRKTFPREKLEDRRNLPKCPGTGKSMPHCVVPTRQSPVHTVDAQ